MTRTRENGCPALFGQPFQSLKNRKLWGFLFFFLSVQVFAQTGLNITIEENNGKITILRCRGTIKDLTIPDTINNIPVTAIGDYAFAKKDISTVVIPDSVTTIGKGAFAENRLTELVIGDNVTSLGRGAFAHNRLVRLTIGRGITVLPRGCFQVNQLASVEIPDTVTGIEEYVFFSNRLTGITIPQNVTEIGEGAFSGNRMTSIAITGGVQRIGDGAFYNNELSNITIPGGIGELGKRVFNNKPSASGLRSQINYLDTYDNVLFSSNGSFDSYFESQDRKPGTYIFADGAWSVQ